MSAAPTQGSWDNDPPLLRVTLALTDALNCIDADEIDMDELSSCINDAYCALLANRPKYDQSALPARVLDTESALPGPSGRGDKSVAAMIVIVSVWIFVDSLSGILTDLFLMLL